MVDFSVLNLVNMQRYIDDSGGGGHCILIKLINYDELCTTIGNADSTLLKLFKIVQNKSENFTKTIFGQIEHNKILIIIPRLEKTELKKMIYNIYEESQLYTNDVEPSQYINCHIASIDFPENSNDAKEIYTLLISRIASFKGNNYYYEYDKNFHFSDNIKYINQNLNLLRKAINNNLLQFMYQPIIDSNTNHVPYHECLLRFPNDKNELISIGPMIKAAEDKGLMNVIDHKVFEMVVKELAEFENIHLAVNISNIGLTDDHFLIYAKQLLKEYQVANRLIIEITETTISQDYHKTKNFMYSLNEFGCKFALDDFGSGFTSFKQLKDLPIDIIKIDGSYIIDIINNYPSKYFVEALIKMADDLGIKTVAEFVENGETAKFLMDIKIDYMQGNYFSSAKRKRYT